MRRSFRADELDLVTKSLQDQQLQPSLCSFMIALNLERNTAAVECSTIPLQLVDCLLGGGRKDESSV